MSTVLEQIPVDTPAIEGAYWQENLGPELFGSSVPINANGGVITVSGTSFTAVSDGTSASAVRPKVDLATVAGKTYRLTINLTVNSGACSDMRVYNGSAYVFGGPGALISAQNLNIVFTAGASAAWLSFDGAQIFNISGVASLQEVLAPTIYDTDSLGNPILPSTLVRTRNGVQKVYTGDPTLWPRVLIEPARTNLLVRSRWEGAVAGTPGTAPTGWTLEAGGGTLGAPLAHEVAAGNVVYAITFSASAARQYIRQTVSVAANTTYQYRARVVANPDGLPIQQLILITNQPAGSTVTFYVANNVEVSIGYVPQTGDIIGGQVAVAGTAGSVNLRIGIGCSSNATGSATLMLPNFEAGSFASSPIVTAAATVTRPATVLSHPTAGVLRDQNCMVEGVVIFEGAPDVQSERIALYSGVSADVADFRVRMEGAGILLGVRKRVSSTSYVAAVSLSGVVAGAPVHWQAMWTDQGMAVRRRIFSSGTWGAWGAWATNENSVPMPIGTEMSLGSVAGSNVLGGNYPFLRTEFLPPQATLAAYQAYVEALPPLVV